MTNSDDPIVVAKHKSGPLAFTAAVPFSKLIEAIQTELPAEKVFFVLEGESGFSLREAGTLVVTFVPFTQEVIKPLPPPPPPSGPDEPEAPTVNDTAPIHPAPKVPRKKKAPKARQATAPAVKQDLGFESKKPVNGRVSVDGWRPPTPKEEQEADMFGKVPH